jgi:hypothetical protein
MASRAEQKAAARAAREAAHRELSAAQARRQRLYWLGGLAAAAVVAIVIVFVAAGSGGSTKASNYSARSRLTHKAAVAYAEQELAGIPQHGMTSRQPECAGDDHRVGRPRLQHLRRVRARFADPDHQHAGQDRQGEAGLSAPTTRPAPTPTRASSRPARSLSRRRGSRTRPGTTSSSTTWSSRRRSAAKGEELVPYFTPAYIQSLAAQVPGLNLIKWSQALGSSSLSNQVTADNNAGVADGVQGTPGVYVSGPKGASLVQTVSYPTLAQVQQLVTQYS